jgi:hypothetical protein
MKRNMNPVTLYKVVMIKDAKKRVPKQNFRLKIKVKNETGKITAWLSMPIHKNADAIADKINANKQEPNPYLGEPNFFANHMIG